MSQITESLAPVLTPKKHLFLGSTTDYVAGVQFQVFETRIREEVFGATPVQASIVGVRITFFKYRQINAAVGP